MIDSEDTTTGFEIRDEKDTRLILTGEQRHEYYADLKKSLKKEHRKQQGSIIRYIKDIFE